MAQTNRKQMLEELMGSFDSMRKRMFFRDPAAKSRITPTQWVAVRIIAHNPACTVKEIAQKMQMTSSAATQLVEKLVQNGYVVREKSSTDRRTAILALADKTATEIAGMRKQALKRMLTVFDVLNDKEFEQYVALNKKIVARLTQK